MMPAGQSYPIETRGIGKPDYSKEISLGQVRPGLTLKYNQTLVAFTVILSAIASPYPHVKLPLGAGRTTHLVDTNTGLDLPWTIPQGYTLSVFQVGHGFNQDARLLAYFHGDFIAQLIGSSSGQAHVLTEIAGWSSALIDPAGLFAHPIDLVLENFGGGNMEGGGSAWGILEAVGTKPLPDTKTVKCKSCGHTQVVPVGTVELECPVCNYITRYYCMRKVRKF